LIVSTGKDKKIKLFDPRANSTVQFGDGHQGIKASRVVWLGDSNKFLTTGFSKTRERQFAIWDSSNLSKPLRMATVDSGTGILEAIYDRDTKLIIFAGKV